MVSSIGYFTLNCIQVFKSKQLNLIKHTMLLFKAESLDSSIVNPLLGELAKVPVDQNQQTLSINNPSNDKNNLQSN